MTFNNSHPGIIKCPYQHFSWEGKLGAKEGTEAVAPFPSGAAHV